MLTKDCFARGVPHGLGQHRIWSADAHCRSPCREGILDEIEDLICVSLESSCANVVLTYQSKPDEAVVDVELSLSNTLPSTKTNCDHAADSEKNGAGQDCLGKPDRAQ